MDKLLEIELSLKTLTDKVEQLLRLQCKGSISFEDAAFYLGISTSTLYKYTSGNEITFYKPKGKLIHFIKDDLDAWLRAGKVPSKYELGQERNNHFG